MEAPLTIVYTGGLRGDLSLLPRLYTFIRTWGMGGQPTPHYLFDLGDACAPEVWHCAATGGRSALIALDALGCHAARVAGGLAADARLKLDANFLGMALVEPGRPWRQGRLAAVASADESAPDAALTIVLAPAPATRLDGRRLHLQAVHGGQVGRARLLLEPPTLLDAAIGALPAATLPDPTVQAAVDFILAEARRVDARRRG